MAIDKIDNIMKLCSSGLLNINKKIFLEEQNKHKICRNNQSNGKP